MNLSHKTSKVAITGASGTGKTLFFTQYLLRAPYLHKFVFDHEGEFALRTGANSFTDPDDLSEALASGLEYIVFDPSEAFEGNLPGGFDFFAEWVFEVSKLPEFRDRPKLFACDELQQMIGTDTITFPISCIVETGRRYTLDWVNISQGVHTIHNRLRQQFTEAIAFRTVEKRALTYLEEVGFDPEELVRLPDFHFIGRNLKTGGEMRGTVQIRD